MIRIRAHSSYSLNESLFFSPFISIENSNRFITSEDEKKKKKDELAAISNRIRNIIFQLWREHYRLFKIVSIETSSTCNSFCSFCPVNALRDTRTPGHLPDKTLEKIAHELESIKYSDTLLLFGNNEPLMDNRILDIVYLFRRACPRAYIKLLTNAKLLTPELSLSLFKAGLSTLTINNYSTEGTLLDPVRRIISEAERFIAVDLRISLRDQNETLTNRAGQVECPSLEEPLHIFCALPFVDLPISYTGVVTQCCFDATGRSSAGDVNVDTLKDIWFGEEFFSLREHLLNFRRDKLALCCKCNFDGFRDPFQDQEMPLFREDLL